MLHLLWTLIQGVLFLLDFITFLMNLPVVICVIVSIPIALVAYLASADHGIGTMIATWILWAGFAAGLMWDRAVVERQERRGRRRRLK